MDKSALEGGAADAEDPRIEFVRSLPADLSPREMEEAWFHFATGGRTRSPVGGLDQRLRSRRFFEEAWTSRRATLVSRAGRSAEKPGRRDNRARRVGGQSGLPVSDSFQFPLIPAGPNRRGNLITIVGQSAGRSRIVVGLAAALAELRRSALALDMDGDSGDVCERLGVDLNDGAIDVGTDLGALLGPELKKVLANPVDNVWTARIRRDQDELAEPPVTNVLRFADEACDRFDYVLASVPPLFDGLAIELVKMSGLVLLVDNQRDSETVSELRLSRWLESLGISQRSDLCLLVRDPEGRARVSGFTLFRRVYGFSDRSAILAWPSLPEGAGFSPKQGFRPDLDPLAEELVRLARAVDARGRARKAPNHKWEGVTTPPDEDSRVASPATERASHGLQVHVNARTARSGQATGPVGPSTTGRCRVEGCTERVGRAEAFCTRHAESDSRVERQDAIGTRTLWRSRCAMHGCMEACPASRTHCWDHERGLHPDRVCCAPECDERAWLSERGGTYCLDHSQTHNPYYPHLNRRDKITSRALLGTFVAILVPVVIWVGLVGLRWIASSGTECASEAYEWTAFGPTCHVTSQELEEAARETQQVWFSIYNRQLDEAFDAILDECAAQARDVEVASEGRISASEVLEACVWSRSSDLDDLAEEMDGGIQEAGRRAAADLYEQRTGKPYPGSG